MSELKLEIFDVDRTIIAGSTARLFGTLAIRRGLFPPHSILFIPIYFLLYYFGKMSRHFFTRRFLLLTHKRREDLERVARECFDRKMKSRIYDEAIGIINEAKRNGRNVLLATSSIDVIIKPLADYLEIDYLATRLEFQKTEGGSEISTGFFIPPPVFGEEKKERVFSYMRRYGITPEECSFYTDSRNDLPLLNVVGQPVAVNPDIRLKKVSTDRGWPVRYFTLRGKTRV